MLFLFIPTVLSRSENNPALMSTLSKMLHDTKEESFEVLWFHKEPLTRTFLFHSRFFVIEKRSLKKNVIQIEPF